MTLEELQQKLKPKCSNEDETLVAVPKGWIGIVNTMATHLETEYPDYVIYNIKEKFGILCVYIGFKNANIPGLLQDQETSGMNTTVLKWRVAEAELQSSKTCQDCGSDGSLIQVNNFKILTLCTECAKRYKAN